MTLDLMKNQVHIWPLDLTNRPLPEAHSALSKQEWETANRLNPESAAVFMKTRQALREILSLYLNIAPQSLSIAYTDYKKPYLSSPNEPRIEFNVSHSASQSMIAINSITPIGIDIEQIREVDYDKLLKRFFTSDEQAAFMQLPDHEKQSAFFVLWTQKEALLKAYGTGLRLSLSHFSLSFKQQQTVQINRQAWHVAALDTASGFKASVAYLAADRLSYWQLQKEPVCLHTQVLL